jgi:hypothetical protein
MSDEQHLVLVIALSSYAVCKVIPASFACKDGPCLVSSYEARVFVDAFVLPPRNSLD